MTRVLFNFEDVFCAMGKLPCDQAAMQRGYKGLEKHVFSIGSGTIKNTHCPTRCQLPQDAGDKKIRVPVILGPTAAGKTRVSVGIAAECGLEIVSCDSRQVYRHMDIGTAKPSPGELASVKHWMVDIVEPSEPYSAFRYASDASGIIRLAASEGRAVMVCGGSGLYFQALSCGIGPQVAADRGIRKKYEDMAARAGREAVWERLKAVDPSTARSSHLSNLVRNIRALEVFETMGAPLSELKKLAAPRLIWNSSSSSLPFLVRRCTKGSTGVSTQ
jgi:tRNA A37 N6-isopentenylltransferase MiaA